MDIKKALLPGMAAALLVLACGGEEGVSGTAEHYRLLPTSPRLVLRNVELAFAHRDINLLKAMLSPNFVFYFDPNDVGQNPPGSHYIIPDSWTRTEFIRAVENLFKSAYSVSLTIQTRNVGEPGPNETTYKAENISLSLLVMVDELNGFIGQDHCNFDFERYEGEGGQKYWRLTKWRDFLGSDYGDGYPAVEPASFGMILALYY